MARIYPCFVHLIDENLLDPTLETFSQINLILPKVFHTILKYSTQTQLCISEYRRIIYTPLEHSNDSTLFYITL